MLGINLSLRKTNLIFYLIELIELYLIELSYKREPKCWTNLTPGNDINTESKIIDRIESRSMKKNMRD